MKENMRSILTYSGAEPDLEKVFPPQPVEALRRHKQSLAMQIINTTHFGFALAPSELENKSDSSVLVVEALT